MKALAEGAREGGLVL
ncbi:MAG TPA: hypothetical protein EYP17_05625 [Candidatus Latescibacteria bacterium]|nr:hypothetical protein [Candidatus Latescibacterota bacterium]